MCGKGSKSSGGALHILGIQLTIFFFQERPFVTTLHNNQILRETVRVGNGFAYERERLRGKLEILPDALAFPAKPQTHSDLQ